MKIFISSTGLDLHEHRIHLDTALRRAEQFSVLMEVYGAKPADPVTVSEGWARECDVFVGVYAFRYGTIPPDRGGRSITELEYEEARRCGRRRLCYFASGDPPAHTDEPDDVRQRLADFKQRIGHDLVRGQFTTPANLAEQVLQDLHRMAVGQPVGFDREEVCNRLRVHGCRRADAIVEDQLDGREPIVPSPLIRAWEALVDHEPWRDEQLQRVADILQLAGEETDLGTVARRAEAIDRKARNPELSRALRALAAPDSFDAVRAFELRMTKGHRAATARTVARALRGLLSQLRAATVAPEYRRCFLVTGNLGAGRTHFLTSVLDPDDVGGAVVVPVGPPTPATPIDELAIAAVREAMGQRQHEPGGLRTLFELNELMGGTKVVLALDDVEVWVRLDPMFLERLQRAVSDHGHLSSILWLLLIAHRDVDTVVGLSGFFDRWGALGHRRQDLRADRARQDALPPNIGGWIDLDALDETSGIGRRIIEAAVDSEAGAPTIRLLDDDPSARRNVSSPFVAWTFVDAWRDQRGLGIDYRFVAFVRTFWERRRDALHGDLVAKGVPDPAGFLHNLVHGVADFMLRTGNVAPSSRTLGEALLAGDRVTPAPAPDSSVQVERGLSALRNAGLIHIETVGREDGFLEQRVRLGFELFWEYHVALRLSLDADIGGDSAQAIHATIDDRLRGLPSSSMREGVLAFLLLLLDEKSVEERLSERVVAAVWHSVTLNASLPRASVWFAGVQAGPGVQRELFDLIRSTTKLLDTRSLLALMYFIGRADRIVVDAPERLALLRPHVAEIGAAGLGDYYRYVAERQLEAVPNSKTLVRCMREVTGCEPTGAAEPLGHLSARLLIDRVDDDLDAACGAVIKFLQTHPVIPRPTDLTAKSPWRRFFFGEYVVEGFCEWVVERNGLEAFELLAERNWYRGKDLGCGSLMSTWMEREANIALGYWYRRAGSDRGAYVVLVETLARSESPRDLDRAFHLVRHSVATHGRRDVKVDPRFVPVLQSLVGNPRFHDLTLQRYDAMLRLNLPNYGELMRERGPRPESRPRHAGHRRPIARRRR